MFNHTAQNFYSQNDRFDNIEMVHHQRNISTGMKGGNQKGPNNMQPPMVNVRQQQIYMKNNLKGNGPNANG